MRTIEYQEFLKTKQMLVKSVGIDVVDSDINPVLFPFQRDLTKWAIRKGRAALFADCGLGKTFCQLEFCRLAGGKSIIIAPLSVAKQTVREGKKLGLNVHYTRNNDDVIDGINITNYEMISKFDAKQFKTVVLDESSILKGLDGETRKMLTKMFSKTLYKLCCTATPAPNDITEIANHAEFLGIMSRANMLAMFFVHDANGWRLKGHATDSFYRWLASWAMAIRKPSDLGYDDNGFILPDLNIVPRYVDVDYAPPDQLFWDGNLKGIEGRGRVRKATMKQRVEETARIINQSDEQWIAWCGLNSEATELHKLIPDSVNVEGSTPAEKKRSLLEDFQDGKIRVLVTKIKIAGFGMNFQNAHNMVFVGLGDSYESYYQAIRRCYRFGQKKPVNAYIVLSNMEKQIYDNVLRKEYEAAKMSEKLIENVKEYEKGEINNIEQGFDYKTKTVKGNGYIAMLGDSIERIKEVKSNSIGLSVYSPPFLSLYTYSPTERDLGNSKTPEEFFAHFGFLIDELLRVTMPGRNTCVHVAQVPAMLVRDGYIGMKDFRGKTIEAYEEHGWIYHGEVVIDKDPQAQSIRTHSKALAFKQLHKDSSWLRPALADYILVFRKPGDNPIPIVPDITNDQWIEWARPIWYGIKESDTLNVAEGRDSKDERHICALQLGTIERCIRLWSNPDETVLSPFMGIGSEGYEALKLGRKFVGIELKESYFNTAIKNLRRAKMNNTQMSIDDYLEA